MPPKPKKHLSSPEKVLTGTPIYRSVRGKLKFCRCMHISRHELNNPKPEMSISDRKMKFTCR